MKFCANVGESATETLAMIRQTFVLESMSGSRERLNAKVRPFDTTEVIEAEPQAVLNSLTEHHFQDICYKW
jgi:hypothetical protein